MRVLVVDDEANVRKLLRTVLVMHGHEVIEAENGLQGFTFAKQQSCNLVITDQLMPVLSGTDLIARLATDRYPARYLLISGYHLDPTIPSGLAFLRKPFTAGQLIEAVQKLQHQLTLPEIEREWQQAKARWREAVMEFKDVISDVPSQIPHPDGATRIERAALNRNTAYEWYSQAFHNYKTALQVYGVLGLTAENLEREDPMPLDEGSSVPKHPVDKSASLVQPAINRGLTTPVKTALTKREREVLCLMAEGLTTKSIARELGIGFKTARSHRSSILTKLSVGTTVAAVRWAIREGMIEP
jgi:DNA-binding NarL/FixJ family response regulator